MDVYEPTLLDAVSEILPREVSLCEGSPRAGLEIVFETASEVLFPKFHRHDKRPGSLVCGVDRLAGVVRGDPLDDVGCETHVVSFRIHSASEDVDEVLFFRNHVLQLSKNESNCRTLKRASG